MRFLAAGRLTFAVALAAPIAVPDTAYAAQPADDGATRAEIRRLYEEGKARYETMDYGGAIDLWTKAYAKVDEREENREIRNNLVYNIATAQEKAFELDGDASRLRAAKGLLSRYLAEYKAIYAPTPEGRAEVAKIESRIAELQAKIDGAQNQPAKTAPAEPSPRQQERNAARERKAKIREILRNDPEIGAQYRKGKGMLIGGSVMLGVGGVAVLAALAIGVNDNIGDGQRAAAIGVGALGAGLIVGGAVLVPFGVKNRKAAVAAAEKRVVVTPTFGPTQAGVQLRVRF